jgi:hypothetical protein
MNKIKIYALLPTLSIIGFLFLISISCGGTGDPEPPGRDTIILSEEYKKRLAEIDLIKIYKKGDYEFFKVRNADVLKDGIITESQYNGIIKRFEKKYFEILDDTINKLLVNSVSYDENFKTIHQLFKAIPIQENAAAIDLKEKKIEAINSFINTLGQFSYLNQMFNGQYNVSSYDNAKNRLTLIAQQEYIRDNIKLMSLRSNLYSKNELFHTVGSGYEGTLNLIKRDSLIRSDYADIISKSREFRYYNSRFDSLVNKYSRRR